MVFTVRLIVVVILLLTTCASVPAAQRRSYRRSIPIPKEEADAITTSKTPISNDATNPTPSEPKPKTETSSQNYNNPNDTNAAKKTKSRGNAKYFTTTTTEKCVTSTPSKPTALQTNVEASSNVIETQPQNKTQRSKEIEELPPYKEEKPESSGLNASSKVPRKPPQNFVQNGSEGEQSKDVAEPTNSKVLRKPEKPHNFIQDENEGEQSKEATIPKTPRKVENLHNFEGGPPRKPEKPHNFVQDENEAESTSSKPPRKLENPHNFVEDVNEEGQAKEPAESTTSKPPRKLEKPHNFVEENEGGQATETSSKPPRKLEKPHNFVEGENEEEQAKETSSKPPHKLEKPHNFVQEGEESTEGIQTTKRSENGRSLSMNIEKFISPEFHNQNNFYTSALFPDTKKFMSYSKDFTSPIKSTERTRSFDEMNTELTTPRNQFFDSIFQAVKEDVSESLDGIDKMFRYNQEDETVNITKEDDINNDTKVDVDYKKFRHLEASESKTRNRIHKDFVAEKGVHLDLVSDYNNTKIIDDGISDGLNKIPATGTGVEYKEEGPQKLPDMEKQESKKIVAENPYVTIRDVPIKPNKTDADDALTNKIESDFTKSTQSVLAENIDPITAADSEKSLRKNSINIFKRGSTKKTDAPPTMLPPTEKSELPTSPDENRKDNAVVSMIKQEQVKLSMMAEASSTEVTFREKDAAKENAIVEPVISDEYEKKIFVEPTRTENATQLSEVSSTISSETTLEYPKNNLINVIKRGSTKIAEVDHEYFEGVSITPVTMKPSKLLAVTEEEPNEILPIAATVFPKKLPPTDLPESSSVTEMSSTEITTMITELPPTSTINQNDTTDEDLLVVTETIEIFNVSVIITESDEALTSTVPYSSSTMSDDDNTSYYAASEDDSTTIMYEVTTGDSDENSTLDIKLADEDSTSSTNLTENDIIKQNEIYGGIDTSKKVVPLNSSTTSESPSNGIGRDIHDIEDDLNPDDGDDDYVEVTNRKVNQSEVSDLEGEGEGVTKTSPSATTENSVSTSTTTTSEINNTMSNVLSDEDEAETTTIDILGLTGAVEEDNSGKIAAIVISSVGAVCLFLLAGLLIVMRKRQKRFNYGQRCRPVSLDAYSMDNVSICNTVGRRKGVLRASKRSYGNPAFEDPATVTHPLNFFGLSKFAGNLDDIRAEFEEIPQVTTRTNELPEGCEVKNRYANVIPLPETRVFLNYVEGYPNSDYINANYVRGAKGARHYYIACQAPMQNTIDDFWRMIWEQQSKVILMLTSLFENGIEKCADYLPPSEVLDCHRVFGDFQVTLKKREVKDKYIISSLQLKNMVSNSWREITHLWYLEWPDKGVPEEANSIIAFLIEARSYMKTGGVPDDKAKDAINGNDSAVFELSPVVVHCSPGTGRTGAVIGCDIAIREFELSRQVDIPKIVYKIRRDRASSVQTKEQYAFIYKVINLYATKLTGGALDSI